MSVSKLSNTTLPILLAGGEGTRLRPITSDLPKPLIPVDGTPAICRILDTLSALGTNRAVVTVRYRADDIIGLLGDSYAGIRLYYSREDTAPRGTAGGVRDAWDRYADDADTDALIISGDAVFTCDLAAFAAFHRDRNADASLLCVHVPDPGAFGIVSTDTHGRITGFSEKPCAAETLSDTVNTGIYCLRRSFLAQIPADGTPDFGQDVFPEALRGGLALYAFESDDYWCDVGSFAAYLACSLDISAGKIPNTATPRMRTVYPPHITDSSVGQACFVPATASVRGSILFDRVIIGAGASVTGSILCEGVRVGDGTIIDAGCVIGRGCIIGDHQRLPRGSRLEPGTHLTEDPLTSGGTRGGIHAASDAFDGGAALSPYLSDVGYALSVSCHPEPETAVCFARALAAFAQKEHCVLFLCRAEDTPALGCIEGLIGETLACTVRGTPDAVPVCGADGVLPLSAARMPSLPIPFSHAEYPGGVFRVVLLRRGGIPCAAVFDNAGLHPTRRIERLLDTCFSDALSWVRRPQYAASPSVSAGVQPILRLSAEDLLSAYLARYVSDRLYAFDGSPFLFSCGTTPQDRLLSRLLCSMGGIERAAAPLHFSVQAPSEDSGDILCPLQVTDLQKSPAASYSHWTLLSLLAAYSRSARSTAHFFPTPRTPDPDRTAPLSVPVCAPEHLLSDYRYSNTPAISDHAAADDPAVLARQYAAAEAEDAVLLARDIALLCSSHAQSIGNLLRTVSSGAEQPTTCRRHGFAVSHTDPAHPLTLSAPLSALTRSTADEAFHPAVEGVLYRRNSGTVRIVATRDHNFRIIADAYTAEAAEELFRFAKDRLLCTVISDQK